MFSAKSQGFMPSGFWGRVTTPRWWQQHVRVSITVDATVSRLIVFLSGQGKQICEHSDSPRFYKKPTLLSVSKMGYHKGPRAGQCLCWFLRYLQIHSESKQLKDAPRPRFSFGGKQSVQHSNPGNIDIVHRLIMTMWICMHDSIGRDGVRHWQTQTF